MNRRSMRTMGVTFAGLIAVVVSLGFVLSGDGDFLLKIYKGIDVFGKVYKEVASHYVDEIDPDKFMRAGIEGMLKTLDPYTVYIDEREHDEIDLVTTGRYGGVGITVGMRDGGITVVGLLEGFSAAKHGIQIGDKILSIDGVSLLGASFGAVRSKVRGAPGTEIRMSIEREGEPEHLEFLLLREEIPVRNVPYSGFVSPGIGYVRLERFSRTAGDDVRLAVRELSKQGQLLGLILDLRDNPGGLLDMAVDVASKVLPESSLVVTTKGRQKDADRRYFTVGKPMLLDVPVAVLVDRGSASASEIVAGAIQDLDRGVIVGERTFGKGLVQTITPLSESTSLKITTGRYFTPSGRSIQEIDYFHRTDDGEVRILPDSLRREFRTSHNRSVFERGGIQPDSVVETPALSELTRSLTEKAMFFKFANKYAARTKTLPEGFEAGAGALKDFEDFANESGFLFKDELADKMGEMEESVRRGKYGPAVMDEMRKLRLAISQESRSHFQRHETEIRRILTLEIIGRVNGENERTKAALKNDLQVETAVSLLRAKRTYQQILSGTPR
ncbi:MAG: S41 family peptidase [Bacteroidota bacterium]